MAIDPAVVDAVDAAVGGRAAYSPAEFAAFFGVTRAHVQNMLTRGEIRSVKLGRCRRIPASELDRLLSDSAA
jgi:excisionase family DNA binding protein